jgi:excisionase family DNA binding protein
MYSKPLNFCVRPKTARALAARGQIPAVKVGKSWRYDETTLREWLQIKTRENVQQCPSVAVKVPRTGRSNSNSLAAKLDSLLASGTKKR